MTRFIGTSKDSHNIQNILSSIIEELGCEYNSYVDNNRLSIDKIYDYFKSFILATASTNKDTKFYFILDSLDQLEKENEARKLAWLPTLLPSNIRFIVSTLVDDEFEAYPILFSTFASTSQRRNFIGVADLTTHDLHELIGIRLDSTVRNYDLNKKIKEKLSKFFDEHQNNCLLVKMILDESLKWNEFTIFENITLSNTAEIAINHLFEKIEKIFKKEFVEIALRYLTLSRKGIYFESWIKILSKSFRNPHFSMLHLINELKQYLSGPFYRWYHRKFVEVAKRRYCYEIDECKNSHRKIVEVFKKEKYDSNDVFWIRELSYHAIHSNDIRLVKKYFLLNVQFMKTKIDLINVDELINDYLIAISAFTDSSSFEIIHSCLIASTSSLRFDPNSLTSQMIGRIPRDSPELNAFIENCLLLPEIAVIPCRKYLNFGMQESTKNVILHNKKIVYVALTFDKKHLIANTIDKIIKVFATEDLKTERSKFERCFINTQKILISKDDNKIIYALGNEILNNNEEFEEEGIIEAFNLIEKRKLFSIKRFNNECVRNYGFEVSKNYLHVFTKEAYYKVNKTNDSYEMQNVPCEMIDGLMLVKIHNDKELLIASPNGSKNMLFIRNDNILVHHNFKDIIPRGQGVFLPNSNVLFTSRQDFPDGSMIWFLTEFNVYKLKTDKQIRINKALHFFDISSDGNTVYGSCYNYVYGLDFKNQILKFACQQYISSVDSFNFEFIYEKHLISPSKDNNICFYSVDNYVYNENHDPFNSYNSRETKFIMDGFSIECPILLIYIVFEKFEKEVFLFYDLSNKRVIRRFYLTESNDWHPLCLISIKAIFVESSQSKCYYLISIKSFEIIKQIKFSSKKLFKRISSNTFVISHTSFDDETNKEVLSIFNLNYSSGQIECVTMFEISNEWEIIDWYSINEVNLIYKLKDSKFLVLFNLEKRVEEKFEFEFMSQIQNNNHLSSTNGNYLVLHEQASSPNKS